MLQVGISRQTPRIRGGFVVLKGLVRVLFLGLFRGWLQRILQDSFRGFRIFSFRQLLARAGRRLVQGVPLIGPECLIALKGKAWLDLTRRKVAGEAVDSKDIRKHRGDVLRLWQIIIPQPSKRRQGPSKMTCGRSWPRWRRTRRIRSSWESASRWG